ncbi:MAG: type II secretion system F family protein [Candidatus Magasanikbacteria bacterium]|nr:type II secretion system F family protein [Candidatus Magasanikbacteria bacterium]
MPASTSKKIDWNHILENLQRITLPQKIFFVDSLRVMIKAGLSVVEALRILALQTPNPRFKKIIEAIKKNVEEGHSLTETLEKFPSVFPPIFVKMISAGEISGRLEDTLQQIVIQMKKSYELSSKVRGAMIYPAVVLVAMLGIGVEMVVFVLPKLLAVFKEMNIALPIPTRILIALSDFLINHGILALISIGACVGALIAIHKKLWFQKFWHMAIIHFPIIGNIVKQVNLARFTLTLSSLLKSTIPIIDALDITGQVLGNVHYKLIVKETSEQIKSGRTLAECLTPYPLFFPPLTTQMILVGEQSGKLEEMLSELAAYYDNEVDRILKNISTIIEPLMIIILGVVVGALAVSVIMPLYSLAEGF